MNIGCFNATKIFEEMADLAPDVNLKLLDGIGHLSSLEAPGGGDQGFA